jgi:hypothetical protein
MWCRPAAAVVSRRQRALGERGCRRPSCQNPACALSVRLTCCSTLVAYLRANDKTLFAQVRGDGFVLGRHYQLPER